MLTGFTNRLGPIAIKRNWRDRSINSTRITALRVKRIGPPDHIIRRSSSIRETSPLPPYDSFQRSSATGGKSRRDDPVDYRGATGRVIGSIDRYNRERERAGASCQTSPPVRVANAERAFVDAFPIRSLVRIGRDQSRRCLQRNRYNGSKKNRVGN